MYFLWLHNFRDFTLDAHKALDILNWTLFAISILCYCLSMRYTIEQYVETQINLHRFAVNDNTIMKSEQALEIMAASLRGAVKVCNTGIVSRQYYPQKMLIRIPLKPTKYGIVR